MNLVFNQARHWLWLALWVCLAVARAHAETRVALVSTCGGQAGQDVLALAETALSAEAEITLVERREVERVLQEQELMHCGMSEAGQAVAVGRLLGVQIFASLETVPNEKEALGLVVFDAATGVVLWDSVLPGTNVEQAAVEVDAAVKAGCEKRRRPAGGLTTVCILSVRNADLPREFDSLCQSIGGILQRQLVQSPSLAVLERQHLENVNKERLLPAGAPSNQLLPSLVIVELEISRGHATKGLSATADLSDGTGAKVGGATAVVESQNPADLSDRLLIELEKLLKATPSRIVVDRAREAERFAREARYLLDSAEIADGLRAIEAANALMPTNTEFQEQLVKNIGLYASQQIGGGTPNHDTLNDALDLGLRGLEISRSLREQAIARSGGLGGLEGNIWLAPQQWLNGYYFWDRVLLVANNQDADTTVKIREFQRRCRELELSFVDQCAQAAVVNEGMFQRYTQTADRRLRDLEKYAPSSAVWTADTLNCLRSWLKMAERFPVDEDGSSSTTRMLARLCLQIEGPWRLRGPWGNTEIHHLDDWKLQLADYAQFDELFQEMERHPDPVVTAYGLAGQLSSRLRDASSPASPEVDQQYRAAKDFIRTKIAAPGRGQAIRYQKLLYAAALDLIDLLPDTQTRQHEYQDLFEFMLSRKEIEYWVARMAVDPHPHAYRHYNTTVGYGGTFDIFPDQPDPHMPDDCTQLIANAHRVLGLFRSGETHDFDTVQCSYNTGSFDRELVWIQRDIKTNSDSKALAPWESAKLLFPSSGQLLSGSSIISVAADSNAFYAVVSGTVLRVYLVPLAGGQPTLLGEAPYQGRNDYGIPLVTIPAVGVQKVFVGTDRGVFVFPLEGGAVQHIGMPEDLPSEAVQSLAYVDGKLYAAVGRKEKESFVVAYDLEASTCKVLVSSRRHEIQNGLDNVSPPPIIKFMMSDPERHRVLFTVSLGINVPCESHLGLWQIDTTTGQVKQLVQLYSQPVWANLVGDGTALISFHKYGGTQICGGSVCGVISYELATDHTRFLCTCEPKSAGPQLPAPEGIPRMPLMAYPPHAIIDGWVWFADGRVSTNAAGLEYFPASKETQGAVPFAWKSFHLLGNRGQMAIAGPGGIWLLTLKTHETSVDASKVSP